MDNNEESQWEMPSLVSSSQQASEERQEEQLKPVLPSSEQKQEEEPTLTLLHREKEQRRQPKPVPLVLNHVQWSSVINLFQSAFSSFKSVNWKKKRVVVIVSVLCIVAVLGAIIFSVWKQLAPPDVTLYRVGFQNITQSSGGGGIVYPRQQLHITFPIAERVVAVLVQPGDQVSPNQPLIQLDPTQLTAEKKQASADVAAHKYSALVAATTSPLLHNGSLVSPISGVVTAVNVNPNEVFTANSNLLTIMDESTVIVHVKIPISALEQIHPGQSAIVTPSALSNLNFKGTVKAIIPNTDPQTDTFEVWVEVVNSSGVLLPGMSTFVSIQESVHALVVPRLAVLNPDLESAVFIVRKQHAYLQHVQVLGYSGDSIFIGTGLSAGDMIVLVGLNSLRDGQEVHVTSVER
jgi:multidrug efflux pump subunit AcrA (membrane-fusion protein)